jgi:cytidylate kinase
MNIKEKANNRDSRFVIALDGPSASGKGLLGSMLAEKFTLNYVQSSIVYRGLAYICLQKNINLEDVTAIIELSATEDVISRVYGVDLNVERIGDIASKLSIIPEVRKNLGLYLKHLIETTPRIIMEGRDIGTVVAPNADLKIFITADVEVRAKRRFKQLRMEGKDCILSEVLDLLKDRDNRDITRSAAPLKQAEDALVIDTTNLTPIQVIQKIEDFISK